jgi:hypothetical protein
MKRFTLLALVLALVLSAFGFISPAAAAPDAGRKAKVSVIHGIPGQDLGLPAELPVDILVNDAICLLKGFEFGEIVGPVNLDAGTYNFKISPANTAAPCSNAPVITADVPFAAGENSTVIAHLTEAGAPTASKFVNDVSLGTRMMSRLTVRHTAAAPAVDLGVGISFGDLTLGTKIEGLANPEQAGPVNIPAYRYEVTLYPAGSDTAVFGPVTLNLRPRTAYFVYAVGSLANNTFTLITQTVSIKK